VKVLIDTSQVTSEASTIKIKPKEHLHVLRIFHRTPVCVTKKPRAKHNWDKENSSL
jgi:hypothetical protein